LLEDQEFTMPPLLIDAHQDIAFNMLEFGRDYRRSVAETRAKEIKTTTPERNGQTLLGWEEYQRGQVGLIVGTLFISPKSNAMTWQKQSYGDTATARKLHLAQFNAYERLCDQSPEMFRLIRTAADLQTVLSDWQTPADFPHTTHPVGIIVSMEGAEGLPRLDDLVEWRERGLRMLGPVWGGGRYCGAAWGEDLRIGFDKEGYDLLHLMADLGIGLDVSHMNHRSMRQAIDAYPGDNVYASHITSEVIYGRQKERLINDECIAALIERDGVIGIVPSNSFLRSDWKRGTDRKMVTLEDAANHIDHICQIAGSTKHAAIGTDFDGGFGLSNVPGELNSIADLQLLTGTLANRGYNEDDIQNIFNGNWLRILSKLFT
jgi:membrane dipeptidase